MPKKNPDFEANTIGFTFGEAGSVAVAIADLPTDIVAKLALHGLSQKLGDSYAGAKSTCAETGADPDEWAKAQVEAVFAQLVEGNWTTRTPGSRTATDLATALSEVTGAPLEECIARLDDADKDEKKGLRNHAKIKVILERIKKERAEKKAEKLAAAAAEASDDDLVAFVS